MAILGTYLALAAKAETGDVSKFKKEDSMQEIKQDSNFRMIDVADKTPTRRRAVAFGKIHMAPEIVDKIRSRNTPKGDVLALAEVAGIMAAKNTPQILPLCHPLLIESVRVKTECFHDYILASCEVIITGKTGVEMEALTGVNAALLCIYDLTKIMDPVLKISDVYLGLKEGGKSGVWTNPKYGEDSKASNSTLSPAAASLVQTEKTLEGARAAVITISDRCSRNEVVDVSGPVLKEYLLSKKASVDSNITVVPDDIDQIQKAVLNLVEKNYDIVFTTGGTGLSPRDVTPEALAKLFTKEIPGFSEHIRNYGAKHTIKSYLSRGVSGLVNQTLVVAFPGSPKAVKEGTEALEQLLPHALHIIQDGKH